MYTGKDPQQGAVGLMRAQYEFDGDCNDPAVQAQMITKFRTEMCQLMCNKIEVYCGTTTVVARRRKRGIRQLHLKASIITKTTKEKARNNPTKVLNDLILEMNNVVAPNFMQKVNRVKQWKFLNKYVRSLSQANLQGQAEGTCTDDGDVQNNLETDPIKKCGMYCAIYFIIYIEHHLLLILLEGLTRYRCNAYLCIIDIV